MASSSGLFSYVSGNSLFHRLAPISKWIWVLCIWAISFSFANIYDLTPVTIVVLGATLYAGILKGVRTQLIGIIATIAVLILVQGLFFPGAKDVVLTLIPKSVPVVGGTGKMTGTGLLFGIAMSERFVCILFSALIGIMTTSEQDMIAFLSDVVHLPYTYVLITVMALRFIPTIQEEFGAILDAQRSRAFQPERMNIVKRLTTAYIPVIIPLATGAIFKAEEVAVTMQCRAFGEVKRTYRGKHDRMHSPDYAFILASITLTLLYLAFFLLKL